MNRTKLFLYNSISSIVLQLFTFIAGLVIPRLMLITYGSEINGLVSSISQFIGYFGLAEAGLSGASIFALYKPLAEKDATSINGVVSASKKFYELSGYIFTALVIGLSIIYPFLVKTNSLTPFKVGILVSVLGITGTLEFFIMAKYRVLLTADQKAYVINYLLTTSLIVTIVIIVIMTRLKSDIVFLYFVALFSDFIAPIYLHFYVKKHYGYINYRVQPNTKSLNKRWDAFILQLLGSVQTAAPIILATFFTSLKLVSVYTIYNMVIIGVMGLLSIFGTGISASFGQLLAKREQSIFQQAYSEFELLSYSIIAFLFSSTMLLILPFVKLYTKSITDVNYNQPFLGFLFVLNAILYSIKNPQGMLVSSAGLFKETKYQTILQASIALIIGAVLAKPLGLVGILLGLIACNTYRDIDLLIFIPRHLNNASIKVSFLRVTRIFIQLIIICVPFTFMNMKIDNFIDWIKWAVFIAIYAFLVITITSLLTDKKDSLSLFLRGRSILTGGKDGKPKGERRLLWL